MMPDTHQDGGHPLVNTLLAIGSPLFFVLAHFSGEEWRVWTSWSLGCMCSVGFLVMNRKNIWKEIKEIFKKK
jgi:hypothetical protein